MPIARQTSGFFEWHEPLNPVPALGVETARLDECIACYHKNSFRGLFGHKSFGFDQDNLDFLTHTPNAVFVWFWDVALRDITGLYALSELSYVGIHPQRSGIDFSRFPALRTAINHWNKADTGLSESAITDYHLWHYKPRSKSYDGLPIPAGVERLELFWANPASLRGLPRLENLKTLQIHRCRNLRDLSDLPSIAPNLQALTTTTSKQIDATSGVTDHPTLQSAYINGEVVVDTRRG